MSRGVQTAAQWGPETDRDIWVTTWPEPGSPEASILAAIRRGIAELKRSPRVEEVAERSGMDPISAAIAIGTLIGRRRIEWGKLDPRALRIVGRRAES